MRSNLRRKYDRLYYNFELDVDYIARILSVRKAVRGKKFGPEFYEAWKNVIRPYWKQFGVRPQKAWAKYIYGLTGSLDPRYVSDAVHHRYVIPYFDNVSYFHAFEDKNMYSLLFPGVNRPVTVFKRMDREFYNDDLTPISREEALSRLRKDGQYIAKPSTDTGSGNGIQFFSGADGMEAIQKHLDHFGPYDYIVQEIVRQHPDLAAFNPSSVNTIRMVTMVFQGQASILSAILRVGHAGSRVDNISKGGYQAVIRPDGTLAKEAYTHFDGKDATALCSDTGKAFEGAAIPAWDKLSRTVLDMAARLPHLKLIGWDMSVDEAGNVVLIEFNGHFAQNQENCGPTFGDRTEEVLTAVFGKGKGR